MARQNINIGTSLNDGTGDKLRDAVKKINDNLVELYTRTGGDATLTGIGVAVTGNVIGVNGAMTITTNNNGTLTIAAPTVLTSNLVMPFGSIKINTSETDLVNLLLVNGNAKLKGNNTLGNDIDLNTVILNSKITGPLIPATHNTYDVGTSSVRWKDVYVGGIINANVLATSNVQTTGGRINNTVIGDATPSEGRFSILRVVDDSFLGDLLVRNNEISSRIPNDDIELRPDGTGNVHVLTRLVVGTVGGTDEKATIYGDQRIIGNLILQNRTISSSTGVDGDLTGMVAIDNSYIYRCVADYDGSTSIWTRVALSSTPW